MKPLKNELSHGATLTPGTEWLCGTSHPYPNELLNSSKFGRMFPELAGFIFHPDFLHQLGDKNGFMAGDVGDNPLSTRIPSGFTFLGQFIDHDITLDTTSSLERRNDPNMTLNFRTPALELDNVYGQGKDASSFLYARKPKPNEKQASDKLLLGDKGKDLPRNPQGVALIGDFRNDENFFVAHLQLMFLMFHNVVVDKVEHCVACMEDGNVPCDDEDLCKHIMEDFVDVFETSRQLVTWHYQWMVVHEYLPLIIGEDLVFDILTNGLQYYKPSMYGGHSPNTLNPFIPIEFSVAAFRFGHSQVNRNLKDKSGMSRPLFGDNAFSEGFTSLTINPTIEIDWHQLFDLGDTDPATPEKAARIDTKIASPLMDLPGAVVADIPSLAERNLLRGNSFALPTGETVARAMGVPVLTAAELGSDIINLFNQFNMPTADGKTQTPLWFYILKESEVKTGGETLGPVGGRIVGEVLLGLLMYDPQSYINANPNWSPLFGKEKGKFTMVDLLHFAGVV